MCVYDKDDSCLTAVDAFKWQVPAQMSVAQLSFVPVIGEVPWVFPSELSTLPTPARLCVWETVTMVTCGPAFPTCTHSLGHRP